MTSVDDFLKAHPMPEKAIRTSFDLYLKQYTEFKKICKRHKVTTSEMLNVLISEFLQKHRSAKP